MRTLFASAIIAASLFSAAAAQEPTREDTAMGIAMLILYDEACDAISDRSRFMMSLAASDLNDNLLIAKKYVEMKDIYEDLGRLTWCVITRERISDMGAD